MFILLFSAEGRSLNDLEIVVAEYKLLFAG